jgi:hypothetical protein
MSTAAGIPVQDTLRYPIGKFVAPNEITETDVREWIAAIQALPTELRQSIRALDAAKLDTPYREGGWTVRQVVHHLADSHMNSYMRFRLALTEDTPHVKLYDEKGWAELADAKTAPPDLSLGLLDSLHARWVLLLKSMSGDDWKRRFQHPKMGDVRLDSSLGMYAWHGRHHVAHIAALRARCGW